MDRPRSVWGLTYLAALLALSCGGGGGGGSSPTAPEGPLTTFEGTWRGEMSNGATGPPFRCTLTVVLGPPRRQDELTTYDGTMTASCGQGSGTGVAFLTETGFALAPLVILAQSPDVPGVAGPLYSCGWGSFAMLQGRRITGDWQPSDTCEDLEVSGGPLTLTFDG